MEKINLEFSQDELDDIFDCLIGSYSCPPDYVHLLDYLYKYTHGKGVYCK